MITVIWQCNARPPLWADPPPGGGGVPMMKTATQSRLHEAVPTSVALGLKMLRAILFQNRIPSVYARSRVRCGVTPSSGDIQAEWQWLFSSNNFWGSCMSSAGPSDSGQEKWPRGITFSEWRKLKVTLVTINGTFLHCVHKRRGYPLAAKPPESSLSLVCHCHLTEKAETEVTVFCVQTWTRLQHVVTTKAKVELQHQTAIVHLLS